jgi:hypothetical protein
MWKPPIIGIYGFENHQSKNTASGHIVDANYRPGGVIDRRRNVTWQNLNPIGADLQMEFADFDEILQTFWVTSKGHQSM